MVSGGADEIGVQLFGDLTDLPIGELVESLLRGDDAAVVVALESAVGDQLGGLSEPLGGALEVVPAIVGNREVDDDGASNLRPYVGCLLKWLVLVKLLPVGEAMVRDTWTDSRSVRDSRPA